MKIIIIQSFNFNLNIAKCAFDTYTYANTNSFDIKTNHLSKEKIIIIIIIKT